MKVSASFVRLTAAALCATALAACASSRPTNGSGSIVPQEAPTTLGPAAEAGPSVHWRTSISGDTVVVEVQDRNNAYRVEKIELLAPDGRIFPSHDITRERLTPGSTPWSAGGVGVGVGGYGGSSSGTNVGALFSIPLGGGSSGDPAGTEARTTARIHVPANYNATANDWKVKVSFSDLGGYNSAAMFPAPKP